MRIKINSWYNQYLIWFYWYNRVWYKSLYSQLPTNLCSYFWQLVLAIIAGPVMVFYRMPLFILLVVKPDGKKEIETFRDAFFLCAGLWCVTAIVLILIISSIKHPVGIGILMGSTGAIIGIIYLIKKVLRLIKKSKKSRISLKETIVMQYVKAKKEKLCPTIDYVNGNGSYV